MIYQYPYFRRLWTFFLIISLFSFSAFVVQAKTSTFRIFIDPGHGGKDRGAEVDHLTEAEWNLNFAQLLSKTVKTYSSQFETKLSRTGDYFVLLKERVKAANAWNADLFLSLHLNAAKPDYQSSAQGFEIYFRPSLSIQEERWLSAKREDHHKTFISQADENQSFEALIIDDLRQKQNTILSQHLTRILLNTPWPKVKTSVASPKRRRAFQNPFVVVTKPKQPALLLELGYLTHPEERRNLKDPLYQKAFAQLISQAIHEYWKSLMRPE